MAGTIGAIWVSNVEPLGPGSIGFGPQAVHITTPLPAPNLTSFDVDAFGVSGMVLEIPARPDMRFTYLVSIRNDGSLPVQVVDAGIGSRTDQVSRHVIAMKLDLERAGSVESGFVPFQPFTLAPGGEAGLQMEVRVSSLACMAKGGYASWSSEPVTYRILGLTRHSEVDTGTEIRLIGDGHTGC